jgi:heme-degrading monooxygenase HmoA
MASLTQSLLQIPVRPGAEDEFARRFRAQRVFEHAASIPGFRGGRLLRPLEPGGSFVVSADWDSPDAYQAWLGAPIRDQLTQALDDLVAGAMTAALFVDVTDEGSA